jgi:hypothetical protein
MINAEERSQAQSASQVSQTSNSIPKCVCGWKNCRVYQKAYREAKHVVMDGVIKLRMSRNDPEQAALKSSIDRALKVTPTKRHDWKTDSRHQQSSQGGQGAPASSPGDYIKYTIARHHWTEKHMMKYLYDPENYSFSKPFSVHGANKYLYTVDQRETIKLEADGDLLYLQTPTVPKEIVKQHFMDLKIAAPTKASAAAQAAAAAADENNREHKQSRSSAAQQQQQQSPRRSVDKKASGATASTGQTTKTIAANGGEHAGISLEEQQVLSSAKEEENVRLKDQLEAMQGQLSFLHDMVRKLQEEHYDHQSTKSGVTGKSGGLSSKRASGHSRQRTSSAHSRSGRSGKRTGDVPHEIQLSEEGGEDWNDWYDEDETTVRENDQEDDETTATFQVPYKAPERRNSNTSKATTIVSASTSIKALPREIELDEDEDDSEDHDSLEEEAFDNRSFASSRHSSRHGSRRDAEEQQSRRSSANGGGGGANNQPSRRPSSGQSINSNKMSSRGSVSSRSSKRRHNLSVSRRKSIGSESNKSVSWDKESEHGSTAGVYQVKALTMTDPYGEQGTYTGSISNSTSMPHGFGRLEYDRAGRWYEGDWKHGRWTGQGKLSNGDGDFYEGGLKNDHKHGLGVMRFADGRIFEGEYINGQMIEGKMSYQDGSTYEGSWVDGMRHGRGKCVFTDQSVYEGDFREGEFFGFGKMGWSDGGWYEGEWWNGEMHGRGKEIRPDGSIRHEGDWAKGQPIRK